MKILHVTEAFGGGVQSAIRLYAHSTPELQHFVYGRQRTREGTGTMPEGVHLKVVSTNLWIFLRGIKDLIDEVSPDVIHLHSSMAGLARLMLWRRAILVYSPHCYAFERTNLSWLARCAIRSVERLLSNLAQGTFAVSPHELQLASHLGAKNVQYIPNHIDPPRSSSALDPIMRTGRRVITVGRIGQQKDPALYSEVAKLLPNFNLVWVGDGDPAMRNALEAAGVTVTGWCSKEKVSMELARASLYLHTGAWEAAPIATAEAAAAGLPVIARQIGAMESLGYFVAPQSARSIASAVERFFEDSTFASRVRQATHAVATCSSQEEVGEALRRGYNSAIAAHSDRESA